MSARRVLRWDVPVDDANHQIGAGRVVHVDCRPVHAVTGVLIAPAGKLEVWTEEVTTTWPEVQVPQRTVRVFGTAQSLPDEAVEHLGAGLDADGALVWHLYAIEGGDNE